MPKLLDLFELALVYDRYEFVELLLENGVQLEDFLTETHWNSLFNFESVSVKCAFISLCVPNRFHKNFVTKHL